jgi:hypothetical protein
MNTDYQRIQKFWIFVKCEQHSTKRHKFNLGSVVITWSAIGSWFSFSATSETCDSLSFKISHFYFQHKKAFDIIHYKKFLLTELQGKLPCSEKLSRNSCHESKTSNPNLPSQFINTDFCIFFNPVWAAHSVQWLVRMLEDLEFKSWQE